MANKQFNSVDGYSVGNAVSIITSAGNVTATSQITRNSRNVPVYVYQADTAPSTPLVGDQWYNTTSGVLFEYMNDGTSSYWVDVNGLPGVIGPITISSGTVNGIVYLDSNKQTATNSTFVFDGTNVGIGTGAPASYTVGSSGGLSSRISGGAAIITAVSGDASSTSSVGFYSGASSADNPAIFFQSNLRFATTTSSAGVTGFTERMRIDSAGNVGIGTNAPGTKLDIAGGNLYVRSGGTINSDVYTNYGNNLVINSGGSLPMIFQLNSAEQMRLNSTGLGIGTSSPNAKLSAQLPSTTDAIGFSVRSGYAPGGNANIFSVEQSGSDGYVYVRNASGVVNAKISGYSGVSSYFAAAGGNVGIGTAAPGQTLDVASAAAASTSYTAMFRSTNGNGYSGLVGLGVAPAVAGAYTAAAIAAENSTGTANDGGRLKFYTAAEDSIHTLTERMRIDSIGFVGINMTPGCQFDVNGRGRFVQDAPPTTGAVTLRQSSGDTYSGFIQWVNNAVTVEKGWITVDTSANMLFAPNSSERMRIDSSGNVLIGSSSAAARLYAVAGASQVALRVDTPGTADTIYVTANIGGTATDSVYVIPIRTANTLRGGIQWNGTNLLYNNTSDARAKYDILDADDPASLIDGIQVRQFNWKESGNHQRYGFVAQELVKLVPEAVHQPEDPEEMMAVDYSKLVPMLVKEIQSLRKRVAQLEGK